MGKPNPRKEELRQAWVKAQGTSGTLGDVLKGARTAEEGKAWEGGTSADFFGALKTHEKNAVDAGEAVVAELKKAYDDEPSELPDENGPK